MIHQIYTELEPIAIVTKNDKILGTVSGQVREIDISVKTTVASHQILIIIQAKHYKKKADMNIVGEFASVITDLGASTGFLLISYTWPDNDGLTANQQSVIFNAFFA